MTVEGCFGPIIDHPCSEPKIPLVEGRISQKSVLCHIGFWFLELENAVEDQGPDHKSHKENRRNDSPSKIHIPEADGNKDDGRDYQCPDECVKCLWCHDSGGLRLRLIVISLLMWTASCRGDFSLIASEWIHILNSADALISSNRIIRDICPVVSVGR